MFIQRDKLILQHSFDFNIPQIGEWGPILWKILHILAERFGNQTHKFIQEEETTIWKKLLRDIVHILPCMACKKHYSEYYKRCSKNCNNLLSLPYIERKNIIKTFLYNLHEEINIENKKTSTITFEDLEILYPLDTLIVNEIDIFNTILVRSIRQNLVSTEYFVQWKNIIGFLNRIYK